MAKSSAKEQMQQLAANLQQAAAANNSAPFKDLVASGRELDVLFYAAEFGGTDIVRAILAAGADANKGESHLKPLAIAAEHGQTEVARLLMDAGADVNDVGLLGPPICEAVGNGHVEIVRLLLEHGADPHVKYMGTTLLCVAAGRGRSAVVPLLLKAGLDPNQTDGSNRARTPIMWAAEVGDVQIIRELLAAGSRVDPPPRAGPPKDKMEEVYLEKGSALTIAARHGRAEAVAELLKAGADPKFVDGEGRTAYDWARKSQNAQMLKALIDAGAAPIGGATLGDLVAAAEAGDCEGIRAALKAGIGVDEKDKATYDSSSVVCGGLSALMLAARGGHVDAVKLLLERGANVNALSDDIAHGARPALIYAVAAGQAATVKQLLDAGADLAIAGKAFDGSTGTALHAAARKGDAEMVKLLIAAGAQPADKSGGKPPLHLAAARDHLDVISALLGAKAKIDQKDREGETALHTAAGKGKLAAVKLLIARGAKVNITDRSGATPLYASPTNLSLRETSIDAKGNKNVKDPDDPIGVMKALLAAGADPSIATERHGTVLAHSVSHPQAVQLLLEHKADPNITDAEGNSPLLMAIYYSNSESVRLLLEAGAKANIVNEKGVTPLDVALDRKMTKIAEMIEKAGGKRGKDLAAGKAAIDEQKAKKTDEQKRNADSDKRYRAMLPDWTKPAKSAAFKAAIKQIETETGEKPTTMKTDDEAFENVIKHIAFFKLPPEKVKDLVAKHHAPFLKAGHYLFSSGNPVMRDGLLGLAPTADKYAVMLAMSTNAANYDKGPVELVEELKGIEKEVPFDLTHISFDTLAGEWTGEIKVPARFAKRLAEFCPDIAEGDGSVAALAKQLKKSNDLFFWWD